MIAHSSLHQRPHRPARALIAPRSAPLLLVVIALLPFGIASGGCRVYGERMQQVRQHYYHSDLAAADRLLLETREQQPADAPLIDLERALVLLTQGRARDAEQLLRGARDEFDERQASDPVATTKSWLTDDTQRTYRGDDYELVLIRAFLALSNLLHDGGDAEAYSLQVSAEQQRIIEAAIEADGKNPKAAYQQVAIGPFLRGMLREQTHLHYDDAARSYQQVVHWQPDFLAGKTDLQRAQFGTHSAPAHGVLYVFALVGRGPLKQEAVEQPTSAALLVADRIVSAIGSQTLPPTIAPIKVPRMVAGSQTIPALAVEVAGQPPQRTETITDINRMAVLQAQAIHDQTVGRAVARRVLKKSLLYGAKEVADVSKNSFVSLGIDLAGVAYEATEHADTRCWSLLPASIQVARIELPVGRHQVTLRALRNSGRSPAALQTQTVEILDARNRYVLVNLPDDRVIGTPIVSR
ncbi:MAG: hypothetical protein ACKOBW_15735 [Planctomycetota bacterium]